jgi:hypothetical protein
MPNAIDKAGSAIPTGPYAALCVAALLLASSAARATEPDQRAIACLTTVLLTAPRSVSVKPAADIAYRYEQYRLVKKGVDYTFRKSDGTEQTIGVYLGTELEPKPYVEPEPNEVYMSVEFMPSDNHRYQLSLRPPYPESWYPLAKAVGTPNSTTYVKQLSPEHPLYETWSKLADQCGIEDLYVNSGMVP